MFQHIGNQQWYQSSKHWINEIDTARGFNHSKNKNSMLQIILWWN